MEWNGRRSSRLDGVFIRASERLQRGQAHRNKNRGAEWKRESNQFSVSPRPCESILGYFEDGAKFTRSTRATLPLQPPLIFPLFLSRDLFFFFFFFFPSSSLPFFIFLFFLESTVFEIDYLENDGSRDCNCVQAIRSSREERDVDRGRILFSILCWEKNVGPAYYFCLFILISNRLILIH